jgi:hypothetical protein
MNKIDQLKIYNAIPKYGAMWQKIARDSGEHQKEDIESEALIFVITKWNIEVFGLFDIGNEEHWKYLYGAVRRKCVEYTEKNIKFAEKIYQPAKNDMDEATNPILLGLKVSESFEPLQRLIDQQEEQENQQKLKQQHEENSFSMILAFVELFEALKPKTLKHTYVNIASQMKMSYSWLYRCLRYAKELQKVQPSLFDGIEDISQIAQLGSWRRFKITRNSFKSAPVVLIGQLNLFE